MVSQLSQVKGKEMQYLIELVNQNINLSNDTNVFILVLIVIGVLVAVIVFTKLIKEKDVLSNTESKVCVAITGIGLIIAFTSAAFDAHQHYVNLNKIKDNNVKIEKIEKSTINSQASKYPYCVSLEDSNLVNSTQILVFFNNQQEAINFIQKNQNSKRIFLSNYLSSESDYLSQESNQSIKNNFDQMQVKSTKKSIGAND